MTENESDFFSAIIGYIITFSDKMIEDTSDKLKYLKAQKEVTTFAQFKRDNIPTISPSELSRDAKNLLKFVMDSLEEINKNSPENFQKYVQSGKNIRSIPSLPPLKEVLTPEQINQATLDNIKNKNISKTVTDVVKSIIK